MAPGDMGEAEPMGPVTEDGGAVDVERPAADVAFFQPGPVHVARSQWPGRLPCFVASLRGLYGSLLWNSLRSTP